MSHALYEIFFYEYVHSLEQSCDDDHFFLSSSVNCITGFALRNVRPQPAVSVPNLEKALLTIGELGTLFALGKENE